MVNQMDYKEVLGFYFEDIFGAILAIQRPLVDSYEFLRKKHTEYKYKKLLELKHLHTQEKEEIIGEFIECLPEEPSAVAYVESFEKMVDIFSRRFSDAVPLLEEIGNELSQPEQEKILRMQMQKNAGILGSIREGLSELILDSEEPEKVMVIDQGLVLARRLIDKAIKERSEQKRSFIHMHLMFLLLRIEGIRRERFDHRVLYEDIAIISRSLKEKDVEEIPEGVLGLLGTPA